MRSPTPTDCPGLMPQVTIGGIASPSRRLTSSYEALVSEAMLFHHVTARSKAGPCGAYWRPRR